MRRYDYWDGTEYDECLSLEPGAVRLERLNAGAPFLDSHNSFGCDNVVGSIVPDSATIKDGLGTARVLLSKAPGVADTVQKITEGVLRNTSVGYWIHAVEKIDGEDGKIARWNIKDWEPLEVSVVPIPADPGSQIRGEKATAAGGGPALRSCTFITPDSPAAGPKSTATKETRTMATAPKKTLAERLAALEAENKRLATLVAAKRDADDKKGDDKDDDKDEERASEDEDEKRDGEDADEANAADKDDESRATDDDDDDKDERSAPAKGGKRAAPLTVADVRKAAEDAVRADRARSAGIRDIASRFGLPKLGERHVNDGTSVREFKDKVLDKLSERQAKRGDTTFAAAGVREIDERGAGERQASPDAKSRDFDDAAATARRLLGKKAA